MAQIRDVGPPRAEFAPLTGAQAFRILNTSATTSCITDVAQDRHWRQDRIGKLSSNAQVYSEAEDATIATGAGLFDAFAEASGTPTTVKSMQLVM